MSRSFVKEDDLEHAGIDIPECPISSHPNYVTPAGLAQLQAESVQLERLRTPLATQKDDPVAKQKLAMIDRDLRYVSTRIASAILVNPSQQPQNQVLFGATVKLEDELGNHFQFDVVGEDEADIQQNKISWVSPLARALLGHTVGENVIWNRPAGHIMVEIVAIEYSQS